MLNRNVAALRAFLRERFDMRIEKADENETTDAIVKSVDFRGINLWVLIFAIFIASLGLNINSTAVIIGAMLISPLMGPIMGLGLGMGIYDFELLKRAFKNYAIASVIGIVTSALYFYISPISDVQSELLARTSPTIYDVLIALIGGAAGIVAIASKERGNVIPGVAIATALMPPLCTAGFGLATGNLSFFAGALYLYFINTVFISWATFLGVRFLGFSRKTIIDKAREKRVTGYIYTIVIITLIPSIYLGYRIVNNSIYTNSALKFITNELTFPNTAILSKKLETENGKRGIEVFIAGDEIPPISIEMARNKMSQYGLANVPLVIKQSDHGEAADISTLKSLVLEDFYHESEEQLASQKAEIAALKSRVEKYEHEIVLGGKIASELKILFPEVEEISLALSVRTIVANSRQDTVLLAMATYKVKPSEKEKKRLKEWLKARTEINFPVLVVSE